MFRNSLAPHRSTTFPRRLRILAVLLAMALLAAACGGDDDSAGGGDDGTEQSGGASGSESGGAALSREEMDAILAAQPNPAIIYLQEILDTLGYDPGPVDGQYGPQTRTAIKTYQEDYNLVVDGRASKPLLDHMVQQGGGPTG